MFIALPCVNHSPCILSYESRNKYFYIQYYTSYTVGNVSLGLAHGMEGILQVVTVARDNREEASEVCLNGPALDRFTSQRASSSVTHIGFCFCFCFCLPKMGRLMTSFLQEVPVLELCYELYRQFDGPWVH
jgi:hypothetical protein